MTITYLCIAPCLLNSFQRSFLGIGYTHIPSKKQPQTSPPKPTKIELRPSQNRARLPQKSSPRPPIWSFDPPQCAPNASRRLLGAPRNLQECPRRPPGGPQDGSETAQDGAKMAPRRLKMAPRGDLDAPKRPGKSVRSSIFMGFYLGHHFVCILNACRSPKSL